MSINLSTIPSPNALENLYQVYLMHLHTAISAMLDFPVAIARLGFSSRTDQVIYRPRKRFTLVINAQVSR